MLFQPVWQSVSEYIERPKTVSLPCWGSNNGKGMTFWTGHKQGSFQIFNWLKKFTISIIKLKFCSNLAHSILRTKINYLSFLWQKTTLVVLQRTDTTIIHDPLLQEKKSSFQLKTALKLSLLWTCFLGLSIPINKNCMKIWQSMAIHNNVFC